jgi:hypothetical protein
MNRRIQVRLVSYHDVLADFHVESRKGQKGFALRQMQESHRHSYKLVYIL